MRTWRGAEVRMVLTKTEFDVRLGDVVVGEIVGGADREWRWYHIGPPSRERYDDSGFSETRDDAVERLLTCHSDHTARDHD